MSLILPPPILPHHPDPHWCPRCGQLENAGCNHPRGASGAHVTARAEDVQVVAEAPRAVPG